MVEVQERIAMRNYEMVLVLRPDLDDEAARATVDRVMQWLTERGATLVKTEHWGRRKLAYPIKHFTEGNYFLAQFQGNSHQVVGIENFLNLIGEIIRYLVVKLE